MLYVNSKIKIALSELDFSYSRSSGPGGQHVNKSNTRASLCWSLEANKTIPLEVKDYLAMRLARELNSKGLIQISSDRFRSQDRNKEDCIAKFIQLL